MNEQPGQQRRQPRETVITSALGRRLRPALLVDLAAIAFALGIGIYVGRVEVGSGDYGQWLMLSRFYMGQDIPAYRDASAVPPLMPVLLAITRLGLTDPFTALQFFKGGIAVALVLALYAAGTTLYRQRSAGVLTAVASFLMTDRLLEPFAFGGLPQTLALTFMILSIAAFGWASNSSGERTLWWVLGSVGIALAGLSHFGTGVMAAGTGMAVAGVSVLRTPGIPMRNRILNLAPLTVTVILLAIYWRVALLPANLGSVSNPASLDYRGPALLWEILRSHRPTVVLLGLGAALVAVGSGAELLSRRIGGHLVTSAWVGSAWGVLGLSILVEAATDYPRFIPLIVAPLAAAAGGGLAMAARDLVTLVRPSLRPRTERALLGALTITIALGLGLGTLAQHSQEAQGYRLSDNEAFADVAVWLDARLNKGETVVATAREGKWIEGLTGREALFSIPVRFSFRSHERARAVAAETLLRSTTSLTNEYFFIKYVGATAGADDTHPREPWIGVNHGGEYVDLIRVLPSATRVVVADGQGEAETTLERLAPSQTVRVENEKEVRVQTVSQGEVGTAMITYGRSLSLTRESRTLDFIDEVTSDLPVRELQVEVRPVPGMKPISIEITAFQADLFFPHKGSSFPHIRLTVPDRNAVIERVNDTLVIRVTDGRRLHLRVSAISTGPPIYELGLLTPEQVVQQYNVGAVLLKRDSAVEARERRLGRLAFQEEYAAGPYVVLVQE